MEIDIRKRMNHVTLTTVVEATATSSAVTGQNIPPQHVCLGLPGTVPEREEMSHVPARSIPGQWHVPEWVDYDFYSFNKRKVKNIPATPPLPCSWIKALLSWYRYSAVQKPYSQLRWSLVSSLSEHALLCTILVRYWKSGPSLIGFLQVICNKVDRHTVFPSWLRSEKLSKLLHRRTSKSPELCQSVDLRLHRSIG